MKIAFILLSSLLSFFGQLEKMTLQSDVQLTVTHQQNQPMTYVGTFALRGECFYLSMLSLEVAYDGQTLYVYSEDAQELTLSTPTPQELLETNPIILAKQIAQNSTITERVSGDNTIYTIVPKDAKWQVNRCVVKLNTLTMLPSQIQLYEKERTTSLAFTQPTYSSEAVEFMISKNDVYINDLR